MKEKIIMRIGEGERGKKNWMQRERRDNYGARGRTDGTE